jgi:thiamine-monophosphate kinase
MPRSEFEYVDWIRSRTGAAAGVVIPPGDDMGAIAAPPGGEPVLVTTDMIAEGTDFLRPEASPERIGYKAMAVSLSDVAAMAALPTGAVAAVMLPADADDALTEGLYAGMRRAADEFGCPLIGGDTNAWAGRLVLCTTVFARPGGVAPVLRSGARPGDVVAVTGTLGGSILGRHLDFVPRIREARILAGLVRLHAMMDLSDGLAGDIRHLCRESGAGALLDAAALPVSDAAGIRAERTGKPAWRHALEDGEDFELLFTLPPEDWAKLSASVPFAAGVTAIGEIDSSPGVRLRHPDGRVEPLAWRGWEHLRGSP